MSSNKNIVFEASTWSELAEILPKCMERFEAQGEYTVFGYASIIGSYEDIQPKDSTYSGKNKRARLNGMEVAMNVFAVGPNEFRGTTDRKNGIYNTGLYAGLEPALEEGGYCEGLNVRLTKEEADKGIIAFIRRELGAPPEGINMTDLFNADSGVKEKLAAQPQDQFGLYKFQMVRTFEKDDEGKDVEKAAIVVSTNEKSKYAAIGLTPMQTAHYILDGQGAPRLSADKNTLQGGTALDYFQYNVLESYRKYGIEQPRINAIQQAVFRLGYAYTRISEIIDSEHLPNKDKAKKIEKICKKFGVNKIHSRVFTEGDEVAKRGDIQAEKEEFIKAGVPRTGQEKLRHVARLFEQRVLDNFAGNSRN